MSWTITNVQKDPMTLTLHGAPSVTIPGGAVTTVNNEVEAVLYHKLEYQRVGVWPFPDGQKLNIQYPGGNNVEIQNPKTAVKAIFSH